MNRGIKILACVVLAFLGVGVIGYITMSLWNWLVPVLFNGPVLTFWQALGVLLLSKILFWGFGGGKHGHQHSEQRQWKQKLYNKFSTMTPEEREAMRQKMKDKWCTWETRSKDSTGSND